MQLRHTHAQRSTRKEIPRYLRTHGLAWRDCALDARRIGRSCRSAARECPPESERTDARPASGASQGRWLRAQQCKELRAALKRSGERLTPPEENGLDLLVLIDQRLPPASAGPSLVARRPSENRAQGPPRRLRPPAADSSTGSEAPAPAASAPSLKPAFRSTTRPDAPAPPAVFRGRRSTLGIPEPL